MGNLVNRRVIHQEYGEGTVIQHLTVDECEGVNEEVGEILVLFDKSSIFLHDAIIGTLPEVLDKYSLQKRYSKCWFFSDDFLSNRLKLLEE